MKVLTSAAALRHLGPAYRFTTDLFYDGEITPEGVLQGSLYVKGHGDPTIAAEKLWKMVDDLALSGVESIEGGVVFDDSFHEKGTALTGWDKQEDLDEGTSYFATLSALSLNANTAVLVVRRIRDLRNVGPGPVGPRLRNRHPKTAWLSSRLRRVVRCFRPSSIAQNERAASAQLLDRTRHGGRPCRRERASGRSSMWWLEGCYSF
jgi:hypothetical protein